MEENPEIYEAQHPELDWIDAHRDQIIFCLGGVAALICRKIVHWLSS